MRVAVVETSRVRSGDVPSVQTDDGSLRRCLATGESRPKDQLLRFVVGPDQTLVFDLTGRLPGRGLWLSPEPAAFERALKAKLFARAAKQAVTVPDQLVQQVEAALRSRCLELIGLARRAGQAICGFEKVKAQLAGGKVAVLLQAADAATDGRDKLRALGQAVRPGLPVVEILDGAELAAILGREVAVHIALAPGGLAERILVETTRLTALSHPVDRLERDVHA